MPVQKGLKNKLLKGLTEHVILAWEEEKTRYARKLGHKVTDLEFLRYLLIRASRPVITSKDGVTSSFLTGHGPVYETKTTNPETILAKYRSQMRENPEEIVNTSDRRKPGL